MLWSRRTIFMALVVGGPVVLALMVRARRRCSAPALRGERAARSAASASSA
jgi:hypothetical protein